jgi:hypothetical protein
MNLKDIKLLYHQTKEDFKIVSGEEFEKAFELAKDVKYANRQLKKWEEQKKDCEAALSIILKDTGKIKGIVDGQLIDIASWSERQGSERIIGISEIKKREPAEALEIMSFLEKKELIKKSENSKSIKVNLKGVE